MTAVALQIPDRFTGRGSPRAAHGTTRPDTLGGRLAPAYVIYDAGRVIGTVIAPTDRPTFGRAAPTVLVKRA